MKKSSSAGKITVITLAPNASSQMGDEDVVRGIGEETPRGRWRVVQKQVNASDLTNQINVFLAQIEMALKDTRSSVGPFQLSEFEVSAGMTATGKLALFTVLGAEAGVNGGLKFVFKRSE